MKTLEITGSLRNGIGKKACKALRKSEVIPCVIYGGEENIHAQISIDNLRNLIYTPEIFLVKLTIEDKTYTVVLKDIQFHPVSDAILHIDFLQVYEEKPIVMAVPVVLQGLAEGVKAGGKLSLEMRKINVKGLYNNIPERLYINVESLGLGKTIQIGQLSFDNLEIMDAKANVVCGVKLTRAARGAAAAAAGK